jgi:hypothetical protein
MGLGDPGLDQEDVLTMQITMTVFSVDPARMAVDATLPDGKTVKAEVQGKKVQIGGAPHGTLTLNLTGAQADAFTKAAGDTVTITVE